MPEDGIAHFQREDILTFEEIERLARLFLSLGVNKVRLTGGEPLLRKDIEKLVESIGRLPGLDILGMTTSGLLLASKIARLQAAGLNRINISLDTLKRDRFVRITRRDDLEKVLEAVDAAINHGFDHVKINCVVMRGINEDEITDFVAWTEHTPIEVRFIEYMPFAGNAWKDAHFVPYTQMIDKIQKLYPSFEKVSRDQHDTSKVYQIPGFAGRFGFITSMSDSFCQMCNRIRITADGHLKVCLFGEAEVSLRDAMRAGASDIELTKTIEHVLSQKKEKPDSLNQNSGSNNRPMILIGG